mmetsp:Transcript_2310/g.4824  ORF Transcript_2310/g.4824 Transcript_2310/m.4824 type:complete len:186 (+) Transcript_2310:85-642(+)
MFSTSEVVPTAWAAEVEICGIVQSVNVVSLEPQPTVGALKEAIATRLALPVSCASTMKIICRGHAINDDTTFRHELQAGRYFRVGVDMHHTNAQDREKSMASSKSSLPGMRATKSFAHSPGEEEALWERYTTLSNAQFEMHLKHRKLQAEAQRLRSDIVSMAKELARLHNRTAGLRESNEAPGAA